MPKIAIKNAFVFDGEAISSPRTIVVDGAHISDEPSEADVDLVIDGSGCTLMPGLIDRHVHIDTVEQLAACAGYGVTTVCDMACWPKEKYNKLHSAGGPTAWLGSGLPAFAEGSTHGKLMKFVGVGMDQAIHSSGDAVRFVEERVEENVDYIKIIADSPGVEQDHLDKIQEEARRHGKTTVAHTADYDAFSRGLRAGFDILTHTPMDNALDQDMTDMMISQGTIVVPTLTMMEVFSNSWIMWLIKGKMNFQNAVDSVTAMHEAGVPILAGTDTNNNPGMSVERGKSLHHELELLVKAGLSPSDALRSATSLAAKHFQLNDRGRIVPGLRADLVLVEGKVTEDITATRRIKRVWSVGKEIEQAKDSARCLMM
ncbi:putative Hydrolase [Seiridium cardinale]